MQRRIILASHGSFSKGILESVEMILGEREDILALSFYVDNTIDYSEIVENSLSKYCNGSTKVIVVTDILGGSVNNEFLRRKNDFEFVLITGMNLLMLLELSLLSSDADNEEIEGVINRSKEGITICNLPFGNYNEEEF